MRSIVRTALIALGLFAASCGGGSSEPSTPATEASATPATPGPAPGDTGAAAAAGSGAPATEAAPPAAPAPAAIKDTLGTVASIDVTEAGGKKPKTYAAPKDVDAILKAIGTDQTPNGPKRKCPDDVTLSFKDDAGSEKGNLGLCGKLGPKDKLEGAEFGPNLNDRAGVQLADADALKKALKKAPSAAPKKPAGDKGAAAAPGAPSKAKQDK